VHLLTLRNGKAAFTGTVVPILILAELQEFSLNSGIHFRKEINRVKLMKRNHTTVSAILILVSGLSLNGQGNPSLTNGLAAYYPFNGNANDESGNGHSGTAIGVSLSNDRFGKPNSCYTFTGFNSPQSFIRITNSAAVEFASDFTFSAWVNFSGGTQGPRVVSTAGYEITTQGTGAERRLQANNTTTSGVFDVVSSNAFPANTWVHVSYTRSSDQLAIYVNGRMEGTGNTTGANDYSHGYIPKLGGNSGIDLDAFGGQIDEVRFYNRALASDEVSELFILESVSLGIVTLPTVTIQALQEITNKVYRIEYKDDVTVTNWTSLVTDISLTNGLYLFPDTRALHQPKRFYRMLSN
jgi:hypothetical protein